MITAHPSPLSPTLYTDRFYRHLSAPAQGVSFQVRENESDLWVHADRPRNTAAAYALHAVRGILTSHIERYPEFKTSLVPLTPFPDCPSPIREMLDAAEIAGVGPMAGVAGMVAQHVGKALVKEGASHVLVENGGDLFIYRPRFPTTIGLFAGHSPLSLKVGIRIPPTESFLGVATSSGTVGPSLSFGKADAVCAVSPDATLADAAATAIANRIHTPEDLEPALSWGAALEGITGIVAIVGSHLAAWGDVDLSKL